MPFFNAPQTSEALTGNGDASGYVTVTSNANYYPGAYCWLVGNTAAAKRYVITDLVGTTKVGVQLILSDAGDGKKGQPPRYTRTPVTEYTVADVARISQEPSTVYVELSNIQKVPLI